MNPTFATSTEPETILTVDGIESLNTYANGAATIGLRISGNLRGKFSFFHKIYRTCKKKQQYHNNYKENYSPLN